MWERKNQVIHGNYLGRYPYAGVVRSSRVKFGGSVQHTVDLFESIWVHGAERFTILVNEDETFVVDEDLADCYN